jgi:iron complex outermembrane receptor protein
LTASYANTTSAVKPFGSSSDMPLPGLSRIVSNVTAYYEKSGYSLRVSQRSRSNFLGEVIGFGGSREYTYIKAESIIDMQAGYEFQSGSAKGLTLLAQVYNANNAAYQQYQGNPNNIINTVRYGKTVLLGATYKY